MKKETKWILDLSHSEISFKVRHLMISYVKGVFKNFEANVTTFDESFNGAKIEFSMETSSIDTGDKKRDEHLKSADFFDASKYKHISLVSKSFEKTGNEKIYIFTGDLTIKEITKPIKLDAEFGGIVKDPYGNEKAGFNLSGNINRKDWNLSWNTALEKGGVMVSEDVFINCDIQLIKVKEPAMKVTNAKELESDLAEI